MKQIDLGHDNDDAIGPGAYNMPDFWKNKFPMSQIPNNPAFTFSKSICFERIRKPQSNVSPGAADYEADLLILKKKSPRFIIPRAVRFRKEKELCIAGPSSDIRIKHKIHGVHFKVGNNL